MNLSTQFLVLVESSCGVKPLGTQVIQTSVHIWMVQFDKVDEGTAIFKVATTKTEVPAVGNWLALDADGQSLPSDWYLRLCGEAQKMLDGKIRLSASIHVRP